jgi:hypothetical protein
MGRMEILEGVPQEVEKLKKEKPHQHQKKLQKLKQMLKKHPRQILLNQPQKLKPKHKNQQF